MVKKIFGQIYLYILLALLYAPILLIIVYSFSNTSNFTWRNGFTLDAYISIFSSSKTPQLMDALKNTILIALIAGLSSTVLGTLAAIGIFNLKRKFRAVVENVNQLPIINSEIVMAVALMIFFVSLKFPEGLSEAYYRQYIFLHTL
jgi:spermidine/putrescine transport system permease protein